MRNEGRERRRKGFFNRLRRMVYGLMLLTALPCAHAQNKDTETAPRKHRMSPSIGAQILPSLNNPATLMSLRLSAEAHSNLLRLGLSHEASDVNKGLGVALAMPDMGYLYVNLYCPDDETPGEWRLAGDEASAELTPLTHRDERALIRGIEQSNTRLLLAPQLVLHLDEILGTRNKLEARLQYAPWAGLIEHPGGGERLPQAVLSWPF